MKPKVTFITSLHRSGSTVLELILRNFPMHVNLGEVSGFIHHRDKANEVVCECGNAAENCEFWGPTMAHLKRCDPGNLTERYGELIKRFQEHFGPETSLVDSSKRIMALQALKAVPDIDVKVIYLVRDVRAWVTSFKKFSAGQKNFNSMKYFIRWYKGNLEIQRYLKEKNVDHFQIGYEELILYPSIALPKIAAYLGTPYTDSVTALQSSSGHSIGGNRMRHDSRKRENIYYDSRWFYNHQHWLLPMILFPRIIRFNTREVYGNIEYPF